MKISYKKIFSFILIIPGILACVLAYIYFCFPKVPTVTSIALPKDENKILRGKYLARHVALCLDCHSERNWSLYSGPLVLGTEGQGGEVFDGIPGFLVARNITPYGIGHWTDSQFIQAMTTGEKPSHEAIFPLMPYLTYGKLAEDDILSIAAYIRTLPEKRTNVPPRRLNFPLNFIVKTIPTSASFMKVAPVPSDGIRYGEYLTRMASCVDCHTLMHQGKQVPGMEFAGGMEFRLPNETWVTRSANITPDVETGIGSWQRDYFIQRFNSMDMEKNYRPAAVKKGEFNSMMPWTAYAGMTEQDLGAIYDYLRTVAPVKHRIEKFSK